MRRVLGLRAVEAEFSRLLEFAEEFACRCGLPLAERSRLMIILEELFTNTIRYGYPEGVQGGSIKVALLAAPGRVEIDFSDDGVAFDPLTQDPPEFNRPAEEWTPGGLGLHIMRRLVHQARYHREDGRNRLVLVRRLEPGAQD